MYSTAEAMARTNEIFEEVDLDGDGFISFSEFVTVTSDHTQKYSREALKKAFEMFDLV